MDDLLAALRDKDERAVKVISKKLFMTKDGVVNQPQISEFQSYAPCRISAFRIRKGSKWKLGGRLVYNNQTYSIG